MILEFKGKTPTVPESCFVAPDAWIIGDVILEENVSVYFGAVLRGDTEPIVVKAGSNIQEHALVHTTHGRSPSLIGENVTVGHRAIIHGCEVQDGCLIGMGAIVLDDALIGRNSLVAAGAVVRETDKFAEGSLVAGVPAKMIRKLADAQIQQMQKGASGYLSLKEDYQKIFSSIKTP